MTKADLWASVYAAEYAATRARIQAHHRCGQDGADNPGAALPMDDAHSVAEQAADEAVRRYAARWSASLLMWGDGRRDDR